jgi:hypothetical protein
VVTHRDRFNEEGSSEGGVADIWCVAIGTRFNPCTDFFPGTVRSKTLTKLALDWQDVLKRASVDD